MEEKQKEKKKSKPFMKSPEKANVKNYSNKILRKNFTNPTSTVAKSTKLSLDKCRQELQTNSKEPDKLKHRKSFHFEVQKNIVSKQFFPVDRCEIVEWPKSSGNARK